VSKEKSDESLRGRGKKGILLGVAELHLGREERWHFV
jgi:hypothetical protein